MRIPLFKVKVALLALIAASLAASRILAQGPAPDTNSIKAAVQVPEEAIERAIERMPRLSPDTSDGEAFWVLGLASYRNGLHRSVRGDTSSSVWTSYMLADGCVLSFVHDCSIPDHSVLLYARLVNVAEGKPAAEWRNAAFVQNAGVQDTDALFLPPEGAGNPEFNLQERARAIRAREWRAAELDPQEHWGPVVKGIQVSLWSSTNVFVRGQPAEVTVTFRNTTTNDLVVPNIAGAPELRIVDAENHDRSALGLQGFSGPMSFMLPTMRQTKSTIDITDCMRDRPPGTYRLYARDYAFEAQGQWGKTIPVLSGDLSIRIVDQRK